MIGQTISHYEIIEKLGEGGMGVVYRARDHKLARDVALKFLSSKVLSRAEDRARFVREAQAAAGIAHANVCAIHAIETVDEYTFIVMELIEGHSLDEVIATSTLPVETALDYARQIAKGLARAHDRGIVHRDVKPANVRITSEGEVKVVDFGLARVMDQSRLTQSGTSVGTVAYMSPEQALGEEIDARSDIFSLGVVIYEMLTGRLPFKGDVEAALLYGIVNSDPLPLSEAGPDEFPAAIQSILDRMLAKDREQRYASAEEVARDIERVVRGDVPELRTRPRRRWSRWAVGVAVGVAVVAAAVKFMPPLLEDGGNVAAAENRIAIMPFSNVVDPADESRLGEIASTLLTSGLSQSQVLGVVSSQRIQDLLMQSGGGAPPAAADIATTAGARWMIEGDILQTEPFVVITTQTVDVSSGEVTASHRVTGTPNETVFSLVDRLIGEITRDPSLPTAAAREQYTLVSELTTRSSVALERYLEGINHAVNFRDADARAAFEAAVAEDSTFAMAHLALSRSRIASADERNRALQAAKRHSAHLNLRERNYIDSRVFLLEGDTEKAIEKLGEIIDVYPDEKYAYFQLGSIYMVQAADLENAIANLERACELDPRNRYYWNQLAYARKWNLDAEGAIAAINRAIDLAPDEFAGYDTRGDIYAQAGDMARAVDSYQRAIALNPDSWETYPKLGIVHLFAQNYDAAREAFSRNLNSEFERAALDARAMLARIPLFQGRLRGGLQELSAMLDAVEAPGEIHDQHVYALCTRATVHAKLGNIGRAIEDVESINRYMAELYPGNPAEYIDMYVQYLCRAGRYASADSAMRAVAATITGADRKDQIYLDMARGHCSFARGDYDDAVIFMESNAGTAFFGRYPMGLAYLMAGRVGNATRTLEAASKDYSFFRAIDPVGAVEVYYYLGRAYEASGWTEQAIDEYRRFLDIWKDADSGIDTIDDARLRLTRLTAGD